MWLNFRVLVGVGTGLGTGIGVFKLRDEKWVQPLKVRRKPNRGATSWTLDDPSSVNRCVSPTQQKDTDKVRSHATLLHRHEDLGVPTGPNVNVDFLRVASHEYDTPPGFQYHTARDLAHFLADWITWEKWLANTTIVHSSMTRSRELAKIISKEMGSVPVTELDLLEEGIPASRSPRPTDIPISPNLEVHGDYPRMEAGFRALFYRPEPTQKTENIQIVIAHPNVIRYFVCRALQLPPEAYTRFSLNHGSLTRIDMMGDGRVFVASLGDTGYQTPNKFTIGEIDAVPPVL